MEYRKLATLDGKAAVFIRGMMNFIQAHPLPEAPLRGAQDAGKAAVEELDETISIPYISKLSVLLQQARVISKERRGQKFIVLRDIYFHDFREHMELKNYGESVEKEETMDRVVARSQFLDFMQANPGIRISKDNTIDKAAYQVAYDKFKRGDYDLIFVKREYTTILAVNPDEGIEEEVTTMDVVHASLTRQ
jgi:hypothetical protein